MTIELLLYSRKECCLCQEMKKVIRQTAAHCPLTIQEIDVDGSPDLQARYGSEVPVLFINGRKAFKYRVTATELERRLKRENSGR
jgi:thioredoxin-related protein